ncbi:MAG TPA: type II secretion system protein [Candidatus Paceibacterota bacterium]|nr:type II secretion system protein [Candidatus Paceibacterota bacterium]
MTSRTHTFHETERGFSLIELLVAISIFIILTSGFILRYSKTQSGTVLHVAETEVVSTLQEARQDAIAVAQYQGQFPSYGVYFDKSTPNQLIIYADCVADDYKDNRIDNKDNFSYPSGSGCSGGGLVKTVTLERGTYVKDIRANLCGVDKGAAGCTTKEEDRASVEYVRPVPTIWLSDSSGKVLEYGNIEVDIGSSKSSSIKTVTIWGSGLIETDETR